MRLIEGTLADVDRDRAVTAALPGLAADAGDSVLRVWTPPRRLAFGRRDAAVDGYDRARRVAARRGYTPIERRVGGSAVAYTGDTVSFAYAVPTDDGRDGIERRYRGATETVLRAFRAVGADVTHGEPADSFCPGNYSIRGDGKIAGIAQRVTRECALVGGCVVVRSADRESIAAVLDPVYSALKMPFAPESVGSIATAGGPGDVGPVVEALEAAFGADRSTTRVPAAELVE
ncbi:lipoate-protein ligase domain protein [Natronomonas moolapensis 8.8.11]|uniref:Lipoate-protein ligase domain protein n=1 Tax=Natronomonas moolapensis (strain DSM 18674 / CECT 7526 / JCM 14361 / 8.8.11) TaxID=268739 RepID=M1Y3K9_NATM8|nr:lipoate--protein ligase family protein [Natronomonas moolapensis]CCQ37106.1 lipoate-protein ligase domain protein [Natronomonas moolapensis 8.8.11]